MKYSIETSIIINAPIDVVWDTFMDFHNHERWNNFLEIERGIKTVGHPIAVNFLRDGKSSMTMKPTVVKVDSKEAFEWQGHLIIKGIFDGHHQFHFKDMGDGKTKFLQSEDFNGLLIRLVIKSVLLPTKLQFEKMNEDFKTYVESKH